MRCAVELVSNERHKLRIEVEGRQGTDVFEGVVEAA